MKKVKADSARLRQPGGHMEQAFQDRIPNNHCFGCGPLNPEGLYLKSRWEDDEAVCLWTPKPHHMAGPTHILNGGIIATIMDCHTICTAIADAYQRDGRAVGEDPELWYATGKLEVHYLKPTPLEGPVTLRARVAEAGARKTVLTCTLYADDQARAEAAVVAVRVPEAWRHGRAA